MAPRPEKFCPDDDGDMEVVEDEEGEEETKFRVGDAVWAKMRGFSAWPGKIDVPTTGMTPPGGYSIEKFLA